jgi:hypothetical protein
VRQLKRRAVGSLRGFGAPVIPSDPTQELVDENAIVRAFSEAGECAPSADRLKRWRRAGLIPRPVVEHPSGLRGSRALYPGWIVDQLRAVMRLHRSVHRLQDLIIAVWWEGHWVDPGALRSALVKPLEKMSRELRASHGETTDPYESADAIVAEMRRRPGSMRLPPLIRERLQGPADVADFLWVLLVLGLGGRPPWEEEDLSLADEAPDALRLVAAATGIDRARHDDPLGEGPLVAPDFDLAGMLAELRDAGGLDFEDLDGPIRDATDQELERARSDALMFSGPLAVILATFEEFVGVDISGFGSLRALDARSGADRAGWIRMMLVMRRLVGDQSFDAIAEIATEEVSRYAAIADLRAGLPEHADLLKFDIEDRLAALPPEKAEEVRRDIDRYLRSHPRVAAALGNSAKPSAT